MQSAEFVVLQDGHKSAPSEPDYRYGCGDFKPRCLSWVGNIKVFVVLAVLLCFVEGFAVNGIANAALYHLEKQFGLQSTKSALIASSQDIGALVVVLFVSFLGARYCKPHWVAVGSVLMGVGSFLFIVPHLTTSASQGKAITGGGGPPPLTESRSEYLGLFMVANMIHGLGFTPMFTLGTVYIDENAPHTTAAVYVGMTYAAAGIGVAGGFLVGGQLTENYYVDFDTLDQSELTFGPRDPQWVGAWWLGFIPCCIAFIILAPIIYGFPKYLPSGQEKDETANGKPAAASEESKPACSLFKDIVITFFKTVKNLVVNPAFMLLSLGAAAETLIISGVTSFSFKFLAEEYSMTFDEAGNIVAGLIVIGASGMLLGGVIIRLLHLEALGMARLMLILTVLATVLGCGILAKCDEVRLAGQEVAYPLETSVDGYTSSCQGNCDCSGMSFNPVCGTDDRVYFSPCHAGCVDMANPGPMATYHNCSCIARAGNLSVTDDDSTASRGRCAVPCDNKNVFLPCLFIMFFCVLLTTTPNSMSTLRVVDPDLRPFALGFQWMLIRLLGTIPGPPVVGYVLDQTCLIWNAAPDGSEFCAMYSKSQMSDGIFIWWIIVQIIAAVCYAAVALLLQFKNRKSVDLS
ncbi:hypothetical protein BaRGS_00006005 [Batillaria attramentaria]|uniref:Solute carrier organic anion transporter family member n=1 Tax=Batillaria attramentaria TaxID=370345 RepID=A0ABD0LTR6_9CAEN